MTDVTHNPELKSWIDTANSPDTDFPIQNLPFGVFSRPDKKSPRVGVAIGDFVLDLAVLEKTRLLAVAKKKTVFNKKSLNAFMALGPDHWRKARKQLSMLLNRDTDVLRDSTRLKEKVLVPINDVTLHLPFKVCEYTDFYASKEHATNVGSMFRDPKNALMPNWLHIPIGYNGRASTVAVSGTPVHRPLGQIKPPEEDSPIFSACQKLDIELEIGAVVGTSTEMGKPISVEQAEEMIFGYVLLNDWSARDIQTWEYQPLGPFQAKAFATTISPWVVTSMALEPFKVHGPSQQPRPLPYLRQTGPMNYDLELQVSMRPQKASAATAICKTNFKYMYWSSAQQLVHHASSGCAMRSGDLLGSGTISGPDPGSYGSLLELTWNGKNPLTLESGQTRTFIEDGDELILTGWAQGQGYRVGFGECNGKIKPAVSLEY